MIIKNGNILGEDWSFAKDDIRVESGVIREIGKLSPAGAEEILSAEGLYVIPGLVDIHIHGCAGYDFCDGTTEALSVMSRHLLSRGITSFTPASMSYGEKRLEEIFSVADDFIRRPIPGGAKMRGIHMEGPFFAKGKKGAQSEKYIINPDARMFWWLYRASGENISVVDIAPELPGAMEFIEEISQKTKIALAHTEADYETASEAYFKGASHTVHLFNAMPPFTHRAPGLIGAAFDAEASVELICDGFHIHPAVIRSVFSWFGKERVVLVSDGMRATGLPDGDYELGGQPVFVFGKKATLKDGALAGSVCDLLGCVQNAVDFGIPLEDAVRAASYNPAKAVGKESSIGSLCAGKEADILIVNRELQPAYVMIAGELFSLLPS